jgi:hypothetical protein
MSLVYAPLRGAPALGPLGLVRRASGGRAPGASAMAEAARRGAYVRASTL